MKPTPDTPAATRPGADRPTLRGSLTGPRPGLVGRVIAFAVDVLCVVGFAAGGRAMHDADGPSSAVLTIAWPFLVGLAVGWIVSRAWRRPVNVVPVGAVIWIATWGVGIALRAATGEGIAPAFLIVSALFLAIVLLGWRAVTYWMFLLQRAHREGGDRGSGEEINFSGGFDGE